jgi:hypothetical protein
MLPGSENLGVNNLNQKLPTYNTGVCGAHRTSKSFLTSNRKNKDLFDKFLHNEAEIVKEKAQKNESADQGIPLITKFGRTTNVLNSQMNSIDADSSVSSLIPALPRYKAAIELEEELELQDKSSPIVMKEGASRVKVYVDSPQNRVRAVEEVRI